MLSLASSDDIVGGKIDYLSALPALLDHHLFLTFVSADCHFTQAEAGRALETRITWLLFRPCSRAAKRPSTLLIWFLSGSVSATPVVTPYIALSRFQATDSSM